MPFVFLILGVLLLIVAIRGTQGALWNLLTNEFTGSGNFIVWISAFLILGVAGYYKPIRPVTHAFIGLIFLVLILTNGKGFFAKFNAAIRNPQSPSTPSSGNASANSTAGTVSPSGNAVSGGFGPGLAATPGGPSQSGIGNGSFPLGTPDAPYPGGL